MQKQQLLAFHYVYPVTLNKWQSLISAIGHIDYFPTIPPNILAQIFNIPLQKAIFLKQQYIRMLEVPLLDAYTEQQITPLLFNDPYYPTLLHQLVDPPIVLYAKGDLSLMQMEKIAIIGSRNASGYSEQALEYIIPPLVQHGYSVVSGFAKGADSLAHQITIKYGGNTIAVLGHGFQYCYPKSNKALFNYMATEQLLITEYPPYVAPQKWHFPMRNRIISGISKALVVTEAALRSGTLITTDHALEHGKDVFAVPGPITSDLSKGTNQLIKDGAIVAWNGYQIINELRM